MPLSPRRTRTDPSRRSRVAAIIDGLNGHPVRRLSRKIAGPFAAATDRVGRWVGSGTVPHRAMRRIARMLAGAAPRIEVFEPGHTRPASTGRHVLLVSHDLSRSGAPRVVTEIGRMLVERGDEVTVLSAEDGPRRSELLAVGATVIVDPAVGEPGAPLPKRLAGSFDAALCNTVATRHCAATLAPLVPTVLYAHETTLMEDLLAASPSLEAALTTVAEVWAGSELSAALVRPVRPDVEVMPYGLDPLTEEDDGRPPIGSRHPVVLSVFGSFEPRKGQDLLAEAVALLDPATRGLIRVRMYGRVIAEAFYAALRERVDRLPEISLHEPLDASGYRAALLASDAVVVPSRSDTLPLVSLDALGAARLLLCTRGTGTSAYLNEGVSGFVVDQADAGSLAATLTGAMAQLDAWPAIAAAGQAVFARCFSRDAFAASVTRRLDALAVRA